MSSAVADFPCPVADTAPPSRLGDGVALLCRNGLHELNPADPWDGPDGRKCRACHLERKRRYNHSEKGKAASARRVFFSVGGIKWSRAFDNPDEVRARIASFRAGQRAECREESARLDEEAAA